MKNEKDKSADTAELRRRGEERLRESKKGEAARPGTKEETPRLLHELQVYEIELEMQNEELQQARADVEKALGQYTDLYVFAPVGYFTLERDGAISRVNLTGAGFLGIERSRLVNRRFGHFIFDDFRPAFNAFLKKVFENEAKETCEVALRTDGDEPVWVHIEATASEDGQGCRAVVVDITERKRAEEQVQESLQQTKKVLKEIVWTLSSIIEKRDSYTAGHQRRVAYLACAIAKELGLPEAQIDGIHVAGILHDIGKIYVPAEILGKSGRLGESEFNLIKMHPQAGKEILESIDFPWPVAQIVSQHHERLNGTGYPQGIMSEKILMEAKIMAVADVVEAMASHRPYRPALGIEKALEEIRDQRSILFDQQVVDSCCELFEKKGYRFQ